MALTRIASPSCGTLCIANLHASAHDPTLAAADVIVLAHALIRKFGGPHGRARRGFTDGDTETSPQVVIVDGAPLVPSSVYVPQDGTLFVGHEADRHAAVDPSRYEPHPKRRIDEGELLLGDTVLPVLGVVRAVLQRAVRESRHLAANATVDQLVLTHPADWGAARTGKLRNAASGLAAEVILVPEPVAAAVFHSASHQVAVGSALAVLDLGGGTVDASVVRRGPGGAVPGPFARGGPTLGGGGGRHAAAGKRGKHGAPARAGAASSPTAASRAMSSPTPI